MEKIKFKFALSLIMLLNMLIVAIFFQDYMSDLEVYFFPILFVYFFVDAVLIFIPYFNEAKFSGKQFNSLYEEVTSYDKAKLQTLIKKNNNRALFTFIVYFFIITAIIVLYNIIPFTTPIFIYIAFFTINVADYFCILIWCPFRSLIFKNNCCTTCRISNWDRLMKFVILLAIPNIYTITIVITAALVFLLWEFKHYTHPERFYRLSNKALHCKGCKEVSCKN